MMGKVIMSGIVPQLVAPVNYPANFADATWAQVIEACQKNKIPDTWEVGDQKAMTINGTSYAIDIIGKNHDDYANGAGKAPLTFQMHDCYATKYQMNRGATNSGGWESCAMRKTHLPELRALLPQEVQQGLKQVKKLVATGAYDSTIIATVDDLFLLSEIEVFGKTNYSWDTGEGSQYAYYAAGNSKIKKVSGTADYWWTRSVRGNNTSGFCDVGKTGSYDATAANTSHAVSFAFCF